MRGDYKDEDILALLLWMAVGIWAASWLKWLGIVGLIGVGVGVLAVWCKRMKWDFWEWLDELGRISCGLGAVAAMVFGSFVGVVLVLTVGWVSTHVLKRYYRRMGWYLSGKSGFVGVVALEWWVVAQLMVAKAGLVWLYFGAWLLVGGAVAVYLRSGRKPSSDLKSIWPRKKLSIPIK